MLMLVLKCGTNLSNFRDLCSHYILGCTADNSSFLGVSIRVFIFIFFPSLQYLVYLIGSSQFIIYYRSFLFFFFFFFYGVNVFK